MSDVNTCILSGRLVRKPELRNTPSGVPVTDIQLANNLYIRSDKERTTFVRCVVWNKAAEFIATLDKGDHIHVQGQLVDDNYTPQGAESPTKGRLKLDNCRVEVLHRRSRPVKEGNGGEVTPDQTQVTPEVTQSEVQPQA